ncbi:MAG TPA: cytochrome P450 [Rhodothermales bacterium]|nr:cytochrome P450 [Rhodothermales bacterium]
MTYPTPPTLHGWPLLGHLLEYRKDHIDVFWRAYKTLGPVFSIRLGPQRAVMLIGPEYHRFFFTQVDKILSMPELYRFVIPMFGQVLNAVEDRDTRKQQLALMHDAFRGKKMQRHVQVMVQETLAWLDTLGDEGTFEIYDAFSALAMNIAANAFMGPEIRRQMDAFLPLYEDLARGMDFVLPPNLPLPRFIRRDRARKRLNDLLCPVIAQRKAHPEEHDDFLQTILDGRSQTNGLAANETVVGFALMSVFTGYITTAAQTCWSLVQLLQHPAYLAVVQDELKGLPYRSEDLSAEIFDQLEQVGWALKESQRMHPVMSHYARYNTQDYVLGGYTIPQGWLTMVCPAVAHRLPEVFSEPDRYDPTRFAPERAEDRRQAYSLIGFSAGLYQCPGMAFGTYEMKCILSLLLQRYTVELLDPDPQRDFEMGVIRPRPPCRVRYTVRAAHRNPLAGVRNGHFADAYAPR